MAKEQAGTNNQGWFARRRERPGARKTAYAQRASFVRLLRTFVPSVAASCSGYRR